MLVRSSTTSGGVEGGGTDDEERATRRGSSCRRRRSGRSRFMLQLLLLGLMAVLATQQVEAVDAAPAEIRNASYLGGTIDVPSHNLTQEVEEEEEESYPLPAVNEDTKHSSRNGYDIEIKRETATLLVKRSKKTEEEFDEFIKQNCRERGNENTFLEWERDQFAQHLKSNYKLDDGSAGSVERNRLRSLLSSDSDASKVLSSMCKPPVSPFDEKRLQEMSENDRVENEIVNLLFAHVFFRQIRDDEVSLFQPIILERSTTVIP